MLRFQYYSSRYESGNKVITLVAHQALKTLNNDLI